MRGLLLLFQSGFPLFSFFLIAVARTSRTMLNSSDESGHPCLVPDLRGNVQFFTTENVCCRLITHGLYYAELGSFYAHFFEVLIINGC